ncbi:MAG: EcoRV family type II restriction endonuclease [Defluviitaleaceae bacterium]|nr:EcoRV family type II restriction endonuclease [Defluviitaleaceae bacterium]
MKLSKKYANEKTKFKTALTCFAKTLEGLVCVDGQWTVKGFIDMFENIYTISSDTKVISKILELNLFPHFLEFAKQADYTIELATHQNWYPDLTFVNNKNNEIKFALDLKTTYVNEKRPKFCNGFTLGSHGGYFTNRNHAKNIQYPYNTYSGHFCLGVIYLRAVLTAEFETRKYSIKELNEIPSMISNLNFFVAEKWQIASDKRGSGNTANIGSIKRIDDILNGNGTFAKAGEGIFDDYWINYGKIHIETKDGIRKPMTSFDEYISYRDLSQELKNR